MSCPFPYTIAKVEDPQTRFGGAFNVVLRIPTAQVKENENGYYSQKDIIEYLRSGAGRALVAAEWVPKNAPGYGIATYGGPRPEFTIPGDRTSKVTSYVAEFRLTPTTF